MKKGINAWCFPDSYGLNEIINSSKMNNYGAIELNLSENEEDILHMSSTEEDLKYIKEKVQKQEMVISSISTNLLWKYPLTGNDESSDKGKKVVEKMIEAANTLEASTILIVPGIVTPEIHYEKAYENAVTVIKELSVVAEKERIKIGIENVWNKFLLSPIEMKDFIDEINNPYVGVYLDIGNILQFGYPEQWIQILSHRIVAVHIKDFNESVGNIIGFGPLLAGDINWNSIKQSLDNAGYDGYIIPEIDPHKHHPELLINLTSQIIDQFFT